MGDLVLVAFLPQPPPRLQADLLVLLGLLRGLAQLPTYLLAGGGQQVVELAPVPPDQRHAEDPAGLKTLGTGQLDAQIRPLLLLAPLPSCQLLLAPLALALVVQGVYWVPPWLQAPCAVWVAAIQG